MLCSLQEAGGAKGAHESASASLNEEVKLIDHLFSPCGHTRCPTARFGGLPNHNLQSQETSPGPGRSRFSASAGDAEGWVLQRVRALTASPLTQPHTDTSLIFSASNPPQIFNPAPHCFSDISLTKMALPADVDFSFSATVFLSTSKAAGIKLALFSIIQHQRHLTDAEEQRFRLNVGRKLSNVSNAEMGKEASRERGWTLLPWGAAWLQPGCPHLQSHVCAGSSLWGIHQLYQKSKWAFHVVSGAASCGLYQQSYTSIYCPIHCCTTLQLRASAHRCQNTPLPPSHPWVISCHR